MEGAGVRSAIDAVWRIESAKLVASLARIVRDVGLAEDLAHDALVAALERWPESGIPDNPGAWLMAVGKLRAIDTFRRSKRLERKHEEVASELRALQSLAATDFAAAIDDDVGDDLLRLIFIACHPILSEESRVALTLRLLGGLTTEEIARAFLTPAATIAQRIVRAKRTLSDAGIAFEVPPSSERRERLASVLEVVYLIFNEGYSASSGGDWMRPALCEDALRLGRVVSELMPDEPEVHGLTALMEIQASRMRSRNGPGGEPVLLSDQDRSRWDRLFVSRGLTALERAMRLGGSPGPYMLQAQIAALHARAVTFEDTDWNAIVSHYDALFSLVQSPVVGLNRAIAVSMARGPAAGLALLEPIAGEPSMRSYHLLPAVRADLLAKIGRFDEARSEFQRAASLTKNLRERQLLLERAAACPKDLG